MMIGERKRKTLLLRNYPMLKLKNGRTTIKKKIESLKIKTTMTLMMLKTLVRMCLKNL
ncbi:MAG: hypothetical protein ACRECH_18070 [Nitrososphaerales archaeon]